MPCTETCASCVAGIDPGHFNRLSKTLSPFHLQPWQANELRANAEKALLDKDQEIERLGQQLAIKDTTIGLAEGHARVQQIAGEEQDTLLARFRLKDEAQRGALQEVERRLAVKELEVVDKNQELDDLHVAEREHATAMQDAQVKFAATERELAAEKDELVHFRLRNVQQRGVLREREEELAAKDEELERAAKKQRKTVDNATRSYAQLGAHLGGQCNSRLVQVKQVPARGSSSLIATDRTPSLLK